MPPLFYCFSAVKHSKLPSFGEGLGVGYSLWEGLGVGYSLWEG